MLDLRQEAREGQGYAADAVDKDPPVIAGDMGSNSGLGRFHMPRRNYAWCATTPEPKL